MFRLAVQPDNSVHETISPTANTRYNKHLKFLTRTLI
jgi:hypothetical protein